MLAGLSHKISFIVLSELSVEKKKFDAVDFFCGAGGMSCGLSQVNSITVLGGIDNDPVCKPTYEHDANTTGEKFIQKDIAKLRPESLAELISLDRMDDQLILAGCSPCQYWSKINTDRTRSQGTKNLLSHFSRFVDYYRPGYIIVENVPGLLTKKNEVVLDEFKLFLNNVGYTFTDDIVSVKDYGVPQKRRRYLLLATRLPANISLPDIEKSPNEMTVRAFIGGSEFPELQAGDQDDWENLHIVSGLSNKNLRRIQVTEKDGGNRLAWADDEELQIPAYEGKDDYFKDVYGRMSWDEPAPTITTRFNSISNGRFGHPEQNRAISLREGATLQTFPDDFMFEGSINEIAKQIGNAVPPALARRLGQQIVNHYKTFVSKSLDTQN